jgi:hypothetical protein
MLARERLNRAQWIAAALVCAGSVALFALQYHAFPERPANDWRKWSGLALFVAGVPLLNPWAFHQVTKFQRWQPRAKVTSADDSRQTRDGAGE